MLFRPSTSSDPDAPAAESVDLGRPPEQPRSRPAPRRRGRSRNGFLLVAVTVAAVGAATVAALAHTADDPPPDAVEVEDFSATADDDRVFITAAEVLEPPLRGTVNRYWAGEDETTTDRAHILSIGVTDPGARGDPAPGAVLVADATRRAQVPEGGAVASPTGIPVRVLADDVGRYFVLEWDAHGWGFAVTTVSVSLEDALRVVDAVRVPVGESLVSGRPPWLDQTALAAMGLVQTGRDSAPAAIAGAPLVGQAGLDTVEAYVYRPDPGGAASFLLSASVSPVLRARHLRDALGHGAGRDAPWVTEGAAVGFDLTTDAPVAFRVTGSSRLVFDHPSGITFWLVSDQLTVQELIAAARHVDFERIALRLTRT